MEQVVTFTQWFW